VGLFPPDGIEIEAEQDLGTGYWSPKPNTYVDADGQLRPGASTALIHHITTSFKTISTSGILTDTVEIEPNGVVRLDIAFLY